jgi:hypothetical protein
VAMGVANNTANLRLLCPRFIRGLSFPLGIRGLTLREGTGLFTGKYSIVINNLLVVTVVLVNKNIVEASKKTDLDLF